MKDLKASVDFLVSLPEVDGGDLTLLGFSAGAAVSVCTAAEDKRVSAVIGCACPAEFGFDEPRSLIERFRAIGVIRDAGFPVSAGEWLNGFKSVSPAKSAAGVAPAPLLLMHGSSDDVVDISQAYRIYEAAKEPKQLIVVNGATHRMRQNDRAMAIVIDWLKFRCREARERGKKL
jgi:dipeptidyl aminopeptidase/acylaminoacyl peptidase